MIDTKVKWTEEKIAKTVDKLTTYFEKYGIGERIMQSDNALIEAPELMAEIADDILVHNEGIEFNDEPVIVHNSIRTPDGTVLDSHHRHDYKTYQDENGETYMVDGGTQYLRRSMNKEPYEDLSVYSDEPFEKIREVLTWGTRGKNGDQPLKWVVLKDMDTDHIKAILDDGYKSVRYYMQRELMYRGVLYYGK